MIRGDQSEYLRLREEYLEGREHCADIAWTYGAQSPRTRTARSELRQLRERIIAHVTVLRSEGVPLQYDWPPTPWDRPVKKG